MDLKENDFYESHLKSLPFGKEKKKMQAKSEKPLTNMLCKHHNTVYNTCLNINNGSKGGTQLVINKKSCGYNIIYDCLDDIKLSNNMNITVSINDRDSSAIGSSKSKISCFKQFVKGTLMSALFNQNLEDSINKVVDIGLKRFRPIEYNYTSLDVYFENDTKTSNGVSSSLNCQKFQKAITVDAYRDTDRITVIFNNWKKSKIIAQNLLKNSLEIEREVCGVMKNIPYIAFNSAKGSKNPLLKDLYHMCTELTSHTSLTAYTLSTKRETLKIIVNFINISSKGMPKMVQSQTITTKQGDNSSSARIKKNFSFSSNKSGQSESSTINVHHSLQRGSKREGETSTTEMLLEYPTSISSQPSTKLKSKKSMPVGSAIKSAGSKHGSLIKNDKSK